MNNSHRLDSGGRVDRSVPFRFTMDGIEYSGYQGDTLASALLANGVIEVAPSLYRRRPRGIVTAGVEEPNALVRLDGPAGGSMLTATTVELYDGLSASWQSGRGRLDEPVEEARYDKKYAHCDVLIIGAGPAGLAAALVAARPGARVIVVDEQSEPGGALLSSPEEIDGAPAMEWVASVCAELSRMPEVRMLARSTAFGYHDHNYVLVAERRTDHLGPHAPKAMSRQRLWHVRAKRVVLATGAHERPIVFADNDRPGVMLASAVRTYVNRYAAVPGRRMVVFTTNDSAYDAAFDLVEAGGSVSTIVDTRPSPPAELISRAETAGVRVIAGAAVGGTSGERRLTGVRVAPLTADGSLAAPAWVIDCDLLAVSGGWNPVVHLFSQSRGTLRYDEDLAAFVPDRSAQAEQTIGAARGVYDLSGCLADGFAVGADVPLPVPSRTACSSMWMVPGEFGAPKEWSTHFVDLQRDSTVADVYRATGAGVRSVEHVKRYTTIGTAHDQGKTSGVNAIAVIADALGGSVGQMGPTTFRAPYTPVSFALLAGRDRGNLHDPVRVTSIHSWHVERGAVFENVGQWKRPRYFPQGSEDMHAA
ncbi:MAG: (2Fe-2S)-binding protein, partial [Longispora sp.]|nr:(2Fe-2S)-binding protein [Longispora sp. (in: high G+C Gram-positive bacteria)]